MRIACWIPKAKIANTDNLTLIAFPLQQRLHDSVSMLRYTYIACLGLGSWSVRPLPPYYSQFFLRF